MATDFVSPSTTETTMLSGNVNEYGVQIKFQLTDSVKPTSTDPPTSSVSTAGGGPRSTSSVPTPTPAESSGLSTGAKVGIGVGVALVGLILLIALLLGGRHVLKKRQNALSAAVDGEATAYDGMEPKSNGVYEASGEGMHNEPYEAGGRVRTEMPERIEERMLELSSER